MSIYIGNIDERVQNIHLKEAFCEFGLVSSAKVIPDNFKEISNGFGFIEMPNATEAESAINNLNGSK